MDQNRHLRHSAYYDFGAAVRIRLLQELGMGTTKMEQLQLGPMLFREEALFKREIKLEDKLTVDVELVKATADFIKWSMRHHFTQEDGTVAAIIQVDGAWVDLTKRKLAAPNDFISSIFRAFPVAADFELLPPRGTPST
jgi:acyl-CoA thioester hydrolase